MWLRLRVLVRVGSALSHRWDAVIVFGRGTGRDQMDDLDHHDDPQG